jgi:hypothetical protein
VKALPAALRTVSATELAERLAIERRGVPFLVYLDGGRRQRIVELGAHVSALSIGREPRSDVSLSWDTEVSRAHAVLERVGDSWTLVDDGLSRNGSYVNGQRVHGRRRLEDGDAITIGGTLLVLVDAAAPLPTTTTTRYPALPDLTAAQRRVLVALCTPAAERPFAAPASNAEIAAELFVTVDTVKSHLHTLFGLFGIDGMPQNRKRAELVRLAFERGVVSA